MKLYNGLKIPVEGKIREKLFRNKNDSKTENPRPVGLCLVLKFVRKNCRKKITETVELEVCEYAGKSAFGGDERCRSVQDPLNAANKLLDGRRCLFQLPLVAFQILPEQPKNK